MTITALMYHAVHTPGYQPAEWDPHYAVASAALRGQLQRLQSHGFSPRSVRDTLRAADDAHTVCITFDDGGSTDADVAAPILAELGATADFFVSAAHVSTRGFVSWAQLRDMATAGMSIQSHGHSHRLLDDLDHTHIRHELQASKEMIEDRLGRPVTLFAPPGGRLPAHAVKVARELGFEAICSSRPGRWRPGGGYVLPRFAVLAGTPEDQVLAWTKGEPASVAQSVARYAVAWSVKKALGNRRYDQLRRAALASAASVRGIVRS